MTPFRARFEKRACELAEQHYLGNESDAAYRRIGFRDCARDFAPLIEELHEALEEYCTIRCHCEACIGRPGVSCSDMNRSGMRKALTRLERWLDGEKE